MARTPYDDMVEAYALRDYTAPSASEYKTNINDKNYSYYGYKRLLKNATAFINWMNAPVLAKEGRAHGQVWCRISRLCVGTHGAQ